MNPQKPTVEKETNISRLYRENPRAFAKDHMLRYKRPIAFIEHMMIERMNIIPETDIWIYNGYPDGYQAVVGANARVYVFNVSVTLRHVILQIGMPRRMRPNGSLDYYIPEEWKKFKPLEFSFSHDEHILRGKYD